jgi:hypothetical protein
MCFGVITFVVHASDVLSWRCNGVSVVQGMEGFVILKYLSSMRCPNREMRTSLQPTSISIKHLLIQDNVGNN